MADTQRISIKGFGEYDIPADLTTEQISAMVDEIVDSERSQPLSASQAAGAAGAGVNVGLADFVGSAVDLVNQIPTIVSRADPAELARKAVYNIANIQNRPENPNIIGSAFRNVREQITGVPAEPRKEFEGQPLAPAMSQNPVGGRQQLRGLLAAGNIGYRDISDVPFNQRAFARAGEVVGSSLPIAALPFAGQASRLVPTIAPRAAPAVETQRATGMFAPFVQKAANQPGRFAAMEALSTALSGAGAGGAETIFPGSDVARITGSVAAPLAPAVTALRNAPALVRGAADAVRTQFGRAGREAAAADELARIVPDPLDRTRLAEEIKSSDLVDSGVPITPGQITGDPELTALERLLVRLDERTPDGGQGKLEAVLLAQRQRFNAIVAEGDPRAIQEAAQARVDMFNSVLNSRTAQAKEMLEKAADKTTTSADRTELNLSARQILDDVKKAANDTEDQLWNTVPRDVESAPLSTVISYEKNAAEFLPGENPFGVISTAVRGLKRRQAKLDKWTKDKAAGKEVANKRPPPVLSGDLLRLRNRTRALQRNPQTDPDTKRRLSTVVEGIDQDLADMGISEATAAIRFTKNKNLTFGEGIVGKTLATSGRGVPKIPAQVTLTAARANREKGDVNFQELREAAGFNAVNTKSLGGVEMEALQKEFLRKMASETAGMAGDVNLRNLRTFISRNEEAIRSLGLTDVFSDTATAAAVAQRVLNKVKKYGPGSGRQQKSFASRAVKMDINQAVKQILVSPDKGRELQKYLNLVRGRKGGSREAFEGLRYAVYQQILDSATTSKGMLSARALNAILDAPASSYTLGPSRTLRSELTRQGILTADQNKGLDALIVQARKLENSVNSGTIGEDLAANESGMFELLARVVGASQGRRLGAAFGVGGTLQAPSAGARAAVKNLIQLPKAKTQQVLVEAIRNPKLMAALLEKTVDISGRIAKQRQINAYLIAAGLLTAADEIDDPVAPEDLLPGTETAVPTTPLDLSIGPRPPQ